MRLVTLSAFFLLTFLLPKISLAQNTLQPANKDSVREFEIIRGPSMRMIKTDTGTLQTIAGGAIVNQGKTKFYADSVVLNNDTRNMEAFGNIHINDGDTVQIYSQYLRYSGLAKIGYLNKDVRLQGRNGTLFTSELDYNFETSIGNYYKGGKVVNGKNVITSKEGTYYADTKDVYFKKDVKMNGPKNHISADSLVYNMDNAGLTFISDTYIQNDEVKINTSQGNYDTKSGNAFFSSRSVVKDSSGRIYTANTMALDGKSGNAQLEGNGVIIDSANGFILLGNQIFLNRKNNSFLATRKPLLIIKQKHDSTYVAADTIFSGLAKMVNEQLVYSTDSATLLNARQTQKILAFQTDSTEILPVHTDTQQVSAPLLPTDSLNIRDTLKNRIPDSAKTTLKPPSAPNRDSLHLPENSIPPGITVMDTLHHQKDSLLTQPIGDSIQKPKDSTRYFIAYHHVRIFNDSLQSVCDSMFISSADSVFRLYYSPVIWSGKTQVSGDTMFLFTKNKEAERLFVFDKAMVVSQTKEGFFNQMTGKTLNAYFINNQFDHIRLKGSQSESVYYLQDEDSAYIGMQRSVGDVIDMIFQKGELEKVKVINQVKGMIYPMNQIPEDQRQLKGFEWLDKRRPKNKAELFE